MKLNPLLLTPGTTGILPVAVIIALAITASFTLPSCAPPAGTALSDQPARPVTAPPVATQWDELVAAAKKEGTVTIYMEANPETRQAITEGFSRKYGIQVEVVVGKGSEAVARISTERRRGIYFADLLMAGETSVVDLREEGALLPLDKYIISPEVLDPKVWLDGKLHYFDKQRTIIELTYYYQSSVLVNTDIVKENDLASHEELLQPKWTEKIVLYDPTLGSGTGIYWVGYLYKVMGQEWADRFFAQFMKQKPMITRDGRLHGEWVARGKYPIGIAYSMSAVGNLFSINAPIAVKSTKEGGRIATGSGCVTLLEKAPHPNAAALMLNWLLSREGLKLYAENSNYVPYRVDIDPKWVHPSMIPPKGTRIVNVDEDFINFLRTSGRDLVVRYFGDTGK